nr:hypothetical protein [Tanacetum cinerariifolium]
MVTFLMDCCLPHTVKEIKAYVQKQCDEKDAARQELLSASPGCLTKHTWLNNLLGKNMRNAKTFRKKDVMGIIELIDADKDVTLEEVAAAKDAKVEKIVDIQGRQEESQAKVYYINLEHADKVLSMQDDEPEPAELKEVIKVVTTAKLMTKVVTAAASTITATPSAAKRRKGLVIRDPEETATSATIIHSKPKSKYKGKGIMMDYFKGMSSDDIHPIFEKYFNSNVAFLEKSKEEMEEEESKALKRKTESFEEKAVKKQKLDEEVPVVDYEIYSKNNKPYYKIIRADGSHQLFLSFLSLLRNFDRENLEVLWQIVKEIFASSKPKNFLDDFLPTTLKAMFKKPDVEAQV